MRLDKFLKVSRIIKRRTIANEVCDAKKAMVNGKVARASYDVKVGDIIELRFESKTLKFKVESVKESSSYSIENNRYSCQWLFVLPVQPAVYRYKKTGFARWSKSKTNQTFALV